MAAADALENCTGFDCDEANLRKNWERHRVTPGEAEEVLLVVRGDARHSKGEKRYYALGQTAAARRLFVAFTIRGDLIRVLSVRGMNRNEGRADAKCEEESNS